MTADSKTKQKRTSGFKRFRKAANAYRKDCLSSWYESIFVQDEQVPPYFCEGLESFGILLKGRSLEQLPRFDGQFEDCFVVNNFDEEMRLVGDSLAGKRCVHVVNRLMTAPLQPCNYERLNIKDVQLPKVSAFADKRLYRSIQHYRSLGLNVHFLPRKLLESNRRDFGREYLKKYPNTGVLAIIYALEILRPRELWVIGLDFYQSDYLVRRPHQNPINLQREKIRRTNLVEVTANIFRRYSATKVNMVSYYKGFPEIENVRTL